MSLLDDVSIVVTPNGYKAGELYAVVPVPTEGAEEVTNGDFDGGTTDWNLGNAVWQQGSGNGEVKLTKPSSGNSVVYQLGLSFAANTVLRYRFDIVDYSGSSQIRIDGYSSSNPLDTSTSFVPSEGNVDVYVTTDRVGSSVFLYLTGGSTGDYVVLDNVSVKEWTGADMDVTRATAATRVDENGLVNYAEILGDSILTGNNSNFDTGIGSWVTYNGGTLAHSTDKLEVTLTTGESGARIDTNSLISGGQSGKTFKVRARIWQGTTTATALKIFIGGAQENITISSTPTYFEVELTPTSTGMLTIYRAGGAGGIGTYFIDDVTVKEAARDNVPRIDYTGGGCPHILAEPQRTNFVAYSIPDNTNWTKGSNTTITENFSTSPDGTQNASRLVMPTGGGTYAYYQFTATSTTNHTFSFYAKNNGGDANVTMGFFIASQTQSITLTNEWKRFEFTTSITSGNPVQVGVDNLTSVDMLIWGCQCEESYATSYIPTSGSTVTRNQDIFTRDGIGSLINSTEGVLFAEIAALSDDSVSRKISLNSGTFANQITVSYGSGGSNIIQCIIYDGTNVVVNMSYSSTNITDFNKIAIKYISGNTSLWVNGVEVDTDNAAFSGLSLSALSFDNGSSTNFFYGKVKQLQVYNTALTDEQLLQLTGESGTDFYESYAEMATALTYTIQ